MDTLYSIEKYNHEKHNSGIKELLVKRNMSPELSSDLPAYGFVVMQDNQILGAGFIRLIEGSYGMLDSYITNQEIDSEHRNKFLDDLTSNLIELAQTLQLKKLLTFSSDPNTINRSVKHGFIVFPNVFTVLHLK